MVPTVSVTDWCLIIRHLDLGARLNNIILHEIYLVIQRLTNMAVEKMVKLCPRNFTKPPLN